MKRNILEEIKTCESILKKLDVELKDCLNDYQTLMRLKETDGNNPNFKKAMQAVKDRYSDINISIELTEKRLESLKKQL